MKPMKLNPVCKDNLWGGNRLREKYGKQMDSDRIAESWELCAHEAGRSTIAEGEFAGETLTDLANRFGEGFLGANSSHYDRFPIMVKLIDAAEALSIQVHPADAYALRIEGDLGKTEMWYILEANEDSFLYFGFASDITRVEAEAATKDGTITNLLNKIPVKPGDIFMVLPGTIHAIGAGILLAEIQQNSNTTYRVYDFGRRDQKGNLRELHIEKAFDVADLSAKSPKSDQPILLKEDKQYKEELLCTCEYFRVRHFVIAERAEEKTTGESFQALTCIKGDLSLRSEGETLSLKQGDSVFIPADCEGYILEGQGEILISDVPKP